MKKISLFSVIFIFAGFCAFAKSNQKLDLGKEISTMSNLINKTDSIVSYTSSLENVFFLVLPDGKYYYKNIPDSMESLVRDIKKK